MTAIDPTPQAAFVNPTIGRIVHFYTTETTEQLNPSVEGPYAALVVDVGDIGGESGTATLKIMTRHGDLLAENVAEKGYATLNKQLRFWVWPPRT
jgi:hypothetical protein